MNEQKPTRRRHHAKVALVEFLRPSASRYCDYSLEVAFQTMRHFVATGVGYKTRHQWHTTSVTSLLGASSIDGYGYPRPIDSIEELFDRFHVALFTRSSGEAEAWRKAHGVHAYAELELHFLHYKPFAPVPHLGFQCEDGIKKEVNRLFVEARGKKTSVSLNSIHQGATAIHRVDVTISPEGFWFNLHYGFLTPEEKERTGEGDSEWHYLLAGSRKDEPFLDTLRRALNAYDFITDPVNAHLTTTLGDDGFVVKKPQEEVL